MTMDNEPFYLESCQRYIEDRTQSRLMRKLMALHPYASMIYTHDDIGTATLIADLYDNSIRYCPQYDAWYIWDGSRWAKQTEAGNISDKVQTVLNLLLLYCKELSLTVGEDELKPYTKYCNSIRKNTAINNIIAMLKTMVRLSATDFDADPYLLNTPACAYNLKTMETVPDRESRNLTQVTTCNLNTLAKPCKRWYSFIDQIMSHDKEKAAFLQRALGYSLLGINREECMFIAYGSQTRNGKGTLFSSIQSALGSEYMGGSDPMLICEAKNGKSIDFNSPQPALRKLVNTRLVNISEIKREQQIDASALKAMTGRDTLTTRGLFEGSFDFVPQYSIWVNTNYLPAISDDTVFKSDRIWVITFDESFTENNRDRDLKEIFQSEENRPTILKWLIDGCADYFKTGLNPPDCVRKATADYRLKYDRIGNFIKDCCTLGDDLKVQRGDLYNAYRSWCCRAENRYKPLGTTSFYGEIEFRGFPIMKSHGYRYARGIDLSENGAFGAL
jgi:putative DNA primase/helicase